MGTIAEKLNYLNTTKTNIKNAIIEKGVEVSDNDTFRSYATKISDIEPILGTKTLTANGTYAASDDSLQGYSSVTVDIDDTDLYRDTTDSTYESVKTLSNCGAFPMLSLTAEINAVQDLHGYDKPWVGGAGKNKLQVTAQSKTQEGVTYTVNDDGTITVSGTATGYSSLAIGKVRVSSSMGNVTISGIADVTNIMWSECNVWDENNQLVVNITGGSQYPSITFDLSNYPNAYYLVVTVKRNNNVATSGTIKPQVEVGSTATSYEPYSNICPISGWDEVDVNVSPLNISQIYNGQIYGDGTWVENNARLTNVQTAQSNVYFLKAGTYTLDYDKLNSNAPDLLQCSLLTKDDNYTIIDNFANEWNSLPFTFTLTQDGYLYFTVRKDADTNVNPSDYRAKILGQTYTTALSTTCYGGSKELISGAENITHGYIASYNGETLPSTWISDRDEYAEGTTPTIGAEVVYELATPTTATSDAIDLTLAEGVNNIWANSGDVGDARYFKKVEL